MRGLVCLKVTLEIPRYTPEKGLSFNLYTGAIIESKLVGNEFVLELNQEGLISLATHLLSLAQDSVPSGYHIHYEDSTFLEEGSVCFVIEKK